jgi:hypothetical protein
MPLALRGTATHEITENKMRQQRLGPPDRFRVEAHLAASSRVAPSAPWPEAARRRRQREEELGRSGALGGWESKSSLHRRNRSAREVRADECNGKLKFKEASYYAR